MCRLVDYRARPSGSLNTAYVISVTIYCLTDTFQNKECKIFSVTTSKAVFNLLKKPALKPNMQETGYQIL